MAVPVAIQRSGNFVAGDDPNGTWEITLFYDDDDIVDSVLTPDEVTDIIVTTTDGNILSGRTYNITNLTIFEFRMFFFSSGEPVFDTFRIELDEGSHRLNHSYNFLTEEDFDLPGDPVRRTRIEQNGDNTDSTFWSIVQMSNPAVPEPATATLLLAGSLALTRRRRAA